MVATRSNGGVVVLRASGVPNGLHESGPGSSPVKAFPLQSTAAVVAAQLNTPPQRTQTLTSGVTSKAATVAEDKKASASAPVKSPTTFTAHLDQIISAPETIASVYRKVKEFVLNDEKAAAAIQTFFESSPTHGSRATREMYHLGIESACSVSHAPKGSNPTFAVYNHKFEKPATVLLEILAAADKGYNTGRIAKVNVKDVIQRPRSGVLSIRNDKVLFDTVGTKPQKNAIQISEMNGAEADVYACFGDVPEKDTTDFGLHNGPPRGDVLVKLVNYLVQKGIKTIRIHRLHYSNLLLDEKAADTDSNERLAAYDALNKIDFKVRKDLIEPANAGKEFVVEYVTLTQHLTRPDFLAVTQILNTQFATDPKAKVKFTDALVESAAEYLVKLYGKKVDTTLKTVFSKDAAPEGAATPPKSSRKQRSNSLTRRQKRGDHGTDDNKASGDDSPGSNSSLTPASSDSDDVVPVEAQPVAPPNKEVRLVDGSSDESDEQQEILAVLDTAKKWAVKDGRASATGKDVELVVAAKLAKQKFRRQFGLFDGNDSSQHKKQDAKSHGRDTTPPKKSTSPTATAAPAAANVDAAVVNEAENAKSRTPSPGRSGGGNTN